MWPSGSQERITWLVGTYVASILGLYTIVSTRVTSIGWTDWGLVTKLPAQFWLGLILVGLLLYPSRRSGMRMLAITGLVILYLYGIPALVKEYSTDFSEAYFYASEASTIAKTGHLVVTPLDPLITYHIWPFFLYFSAELQIVLAMPGRAASDLFSFAGICIFALLAFLIMRAHLGSVFSFYGVIWFLSSFWLGQHHFVPQSYSFILFLALFLILVMSFPHKRSVSLGKKSVLSVTCLLFAVICFSHPLTPLMILSGFVGVFILDKFFHRGARRQFTITGALCVILVIIYLSYLIYLALPAFNTVLLILLNTPELGFQVLFQRSFGSSIQHMDNMSAWAIIAVIVIPLLLAMRNAPYRRRNIFWIAWCLGVAAVSLLIQYGTEAHLRGLLFILVPLSCLSVDYLRKRPRILCGLLLVLLLLHTPAQFGQDYIQMVSASEAAGAVFLGAYTQKDSSYYWISCLTPMLWSQDPLSIGMICDSYHIGLNVSEIAFQMRTVQYAVISDSSRRVYFYYSGRDMYEDLPTLEYLSNVCYHDGSLRILVFQGSR